MNASMALSICPHFKLPSLLFCGGHIVGLERRQGVRNQPSIRRHVVVGRGGTGGRAVLFTIAAAQPANSQIAMLDLRTGQRTVAVVEGVTMGANGQRASVQY